MIKRDNKKENNLIVCMESYLLHYNGIGKVFLWSVSLETYEGAARIVQKSQDWKHAFYWY